MQEWGKLNARATGKSTDIAWAGVSKFLQDCCKNPDLLGHAEELDAEQTLEELKDGYTDYVDEAAWKDDKSRQKILRWEGGSLVFAFCWRFSRPCRGLDQPFCWLVQQAVRSASKELHTFTDIYWRVLSEWNDIRRYFRDQVIPCWTIQGGLGSKSRMRGTRLQVDAISWWNDACRLKSTFDIQTGMSCSVAPKLAFRFMNDYSFPVECDKALIEINGAGGTQSGTNLLMMGTNGQAFEGEYLFPPKSRFRAMDIQWVPKQSEQRLGYWHIVISANPTSTGDGHVGNCPWI